MNWSSFFMMRNEILLLALILIILVMEIFTKPEQKKGLINIALGLFFIHTFIGFFPKQAGEIFGGSFRTNGLNDFFKNV